MSSRLAWIAGVLIGLLIAPIGLSRADEPPKKPTSPPAATAPASDSENADKAIADKDKAADEKQTARDEQEFYDLYKALADTVDQVDRNYVKKVDRRELMEAAIKGVLSKLDPYSSYIGSDESGHFKDTVENQFGGIGIQITMDDGQLKVLSPLAGTPAYKAGLMAGDRIVKIGAESTAGLSLDDAVHRLKGDAGSSISLTVIHATGGKPQTVSLTRETIHIDTVLGDRHKSDGDWDYMLDPEKRIGYIRITTFSRDTAADLKKALTELKGRKLRGLVIDLRFDPGGLLTSAVDTCDLFLSEGRIVSTEGRNTPKRVWDATKKTDAFTGFPMAILVNRYSASASEIVSACLQDHQRAVIIGERTWGKGSVQSVIDLDSVGGLLKLTTGSYQRPNGHNIHRFPDSKETDEWGVTPNSGYEVKLADAEMAQLMIDRRDRDILTGKKGENATADSPHHHADRQLEKALEYVTTELARAQ